MNQTAHIDWLTVTHRKDNWDACTEFADAITRLLSLDNPNSVREHKWQGYECLSCGDITYGERPDTVIAIFRGAEASRAIGIVRDHDVNVTRIDLAVTVALKHPAAGMAQNHFEHLKRLRESGVGGPKISIQQSALGGDTLYVGSRTSKYFGRLYDRAGKTKTGELGQVWRYEVEVKKPAATKVWKSLIQSDDMADSITGWVYAWFERRKVTPVFYPGKSTLIIERDAKVTSLEKKMRWLEVSVKPTVDLLKDAGFTAKLQELFDLSEEPPIINRVAPSTIRKE